jgi:hypothetical protein
VIPYEWVLGLEPKSPMVSVELRDGGYWVVFEPEDEFYHAEVPFDDLLAARDRLAERSDQPVAAEDGDQ